MTKEEAQEKANEMIVKALGVHCLIRQGSVIITDKPNHLSKAEQRVK